MNFSEFSAKVNVVGFPGDPEILSKASFRMKSSFSGFLGYSPTSIREVLSLSPYIKTYALILLLALSGCWIEQDEASDVKTQNIENMVMKKIQNYEDIRYLITDKTIMLDQSLDKTHHLFEETFLKNGEWKAIFYMRGPTIVEGKWSIGDNGDICVVASENNFRIKNCRFIYRNENQFFISSPIDEFETILPVVISGD